MTTLAHSDNTIKLARDDGDDGASLRTIVAREGSELAEALRAGGWVARAGWRTADADGRAAWQLRFERPDEESC